jgi:MFS family permease
MSRVVSALKNEWIAMIVAALVLFFAAWASFQLWVFLSSVLIVGVAADFVTSLFIAGGRGAPQIRPSGSHRIQPTGFVFLAFLASIIVAALAGIIIPTLLSTYIQSWIIQTFTGSVFGYWLVLLVLSLLSVLLVWFDMRRRFYPSRR